MKEFAEKFYGGAAWKVTRRTFIAERVAVDGGLCQLCRERLGFIVHHVVELRPENINDPKVTLSHQNLQYVCFECHNREHGFFTPGQHEVKFDSEGNLIPPPGR